MRALITTLLLFVASPVLAFQGMGPGPGVKGYASGGGGTLLVGSSAVTVSAWGALSGQALHYDEFSAVASGDIAKGYSSLRAALQDQHCKMLVYNSSGTILATSAPAVVTTVQSTVEFTFSGGTITAATTYYLGTVCDYYVDRGNDGVPWESGQLDYSYDAPTNIGSPHADDSADIGNLRIWITN